MAEAARPDTGDDPMTAQDSSPDSFDALVTAAKAVADSLRAGVLRVLHEESYGVLELARILNCAQPALSHHL
jgi:ArsR family transcriptional regulator